MERILEITGIGNMTVAPTTTVINLKFSKVLETYKEALKLSVEDLNEIKAIFKDLGFDLNDLKTVAFDIRTKYKDEYNKNLLIKFENNNKLLSKILASLSNSKSNPRFIISYEVKNIEEIKKELLKKAVEDATIKANTIASASNTTLDCILSINDVTEPDYSNIHLYRNCSMANSESFSDADYNIDFNPEDLKFTEKLNITWSIK